MRMGLNIGNVQPVKDGYLKVVSTLISELGTGLNHNAAIAISKP